MPVRSRSCAPAPAAFSFRDVDAIWPAPGGREDTCVFFARRTCVSRTGRMPCLTSARARSLASEPQTASSSEPSRFSPSSAPSSAPFGPFASSSATPLARFAAASVSLGSSHSSACSTSQVVTAAIRRLFCSLKLVFSSSAVGRTEAHARATAPAAKPFFVSTREDLRSTSSGSTLPPTWGAGVGLPLGLDEGCSAGSGACHSEGAAAAVPAALSSSPAAFAPFAAAAAAISAASRTRLPPRGPVPMLALRVVCARGGHGSPRRWGQWLHETTAVLFFGLLPILFVPRISRRGQRETRAAASTSTPCLPCPRAFIHLRCRK